MASDTPLLFTTSQESLMMSEVGGIDLGDFDGLLDQDQIEEKYDIAQHAPMSQQQQHRLTVIPEHMPLPQMPTNDEFAGPYNFILVPDQQEDTKSWTYSQKLRKVFIEMEKTLPIRIKWTPQLNGLYVKAAMVYYQPTHRSEAVTRCHNHIALSKPESPYLFHVLSCKNTNAIYKQIHGYYSVVVPLGTPQPGSDSVQMDFMFHCKNSCSTGINRRLTEIVFNLENEMGEVLGRRKLAVRICSCPKRDREKEEKPLRELSAPKKRKITPGKKCAPVYRETPPLEPDSEIFTFSARIFGRENFETLKRVAYGLMAETMNRTGQQAIIKPLMDELNHMR